MERTAGTMNFCQHRRKFTMQIEGPFNIRVVTNEDSQTRELQLSFTAAFQQMNLQQRMEDFRQHMSDLQQSVTDTEDDATRQGMLTILQISEQLLPHMEADEIPLDETIVIEIGPSSPFDQILSSAKLK